MPKLTRRSLEPKSLAKLMPLIAKRNLPVILLAASLFMLGIYTVYWFALMRAFKADVARMEQGGGTLFDVQAKHVTYSGFPYRLQVRFEDTQAVRQRSDYVITLDTQRLEMTRLLWAPHHILINADQPVFSLRSRGGRHPVQMAFTAEAMEASVRFSPNHIERLSFDFQQARWTEGHRLPVPIRFADLQVHLRDSKVATGGGKHTSKAIFANMRILAGGVQAGPSVPMNLDLYADLAGGSHLDDKTPALDRWRKRGGAIAIEKFMLARPGLQWASDGVLGLDAQGAFKGGGTVRTNAPDSTKTILAGQLATISYVSPARVMRWQIQRGILSLDAKPVAEVPFRLLDSTE
jgi:hypothetical protein